MKGRDINDQKDTFHTFSSKASKADTTMGYKKNIISMLARLRSSRYELKKVREGQTNVFFRSKITNAVLTLQVQEFD